MAQEKDCDVLSQSTVDSPFLVMLVDDQPIVAESLRKMISTESDIALHYCQEGAQAVRVANQINPRVILLDLVMPDVDGLTILKYLRANHPTRQVPVVVLSSKEEPELKAQAFGLGANDYLVKWPDAIELVARLHYHSRSYMYLLQRDEAYRALRRSQQELAQKNLELKRLASLDALTGVPNRRSLDETLYKEWYRAQRENTPVSLIMLDIDHFKKYNDCYGHPQGDVALKNVAAAAVSALFRPADFVGRYGGEEFVVVLPSTPLEGALAIAKRILSNVQGLNLPHQTSETADVVTVSMGLASTTPGLKMPMETFVSQADQALYQAKGQGRNRIVVFRPDSNL